MAFEPMNLLAASAPYTDAFTDGELEAPPLKRLAVVTCMDARITPHKLLGLREGDMHVMRNGGGRVTDDVVRSLILSTRLLGVLQIAVIHHTSCGNAGTPESLISKLGDAGVDDPPEDLHVNGPTALADDVARLRGERRLPDGTAIEGFTYDVSTGALSPLADEG